MRVHRALAERVGGYRLLEYDSRLELFPPLLWATRLRRRTLTHAPPDHAMFATPRTSLLVVTFHNYVLDRAMRRFSSPAQRLHYAGDLRWSIRRALRRAASVTAVSHATAELVRSDLGWNAPITVIPNGVDATLFAPSGRRPPRSGPLRVLFSGNPTRRKGAQWLAPIAERAGAAIELAATGGLRGSSVAAAAGAIRWLGRIAPEEMPALYRDFDVLLLPSVREGMSLAVLEAMASGMAVVASDIPSLQELILPGKGGLLCGVGDVDAFAAALASLAADPERRQRMGACNRARVEAEYTLERMAARYVSVFSELAPGARAQ